MSDDKDNLDIASQLVHASERKPPPTGRPTATPIYASATYTYESMAEIDKVFGGGLPGYIYTRYGNPTVTALETAIQVIEAGATACAYSSGMAALHASLIACELSSGATVLASQDLYGATTNLLQAILGPLGIKTRVLIAETISNPLLKVCDIDAGAEIAREVGARLIIDNTFASPYLCQPFAHGADLVVHSATKYLGGQADPLGGVVGTR